MAINQHTPTITAADEDDHPIPPEQFSTFEVPNIDSLTIDDDDSNKAPDDQENSNIHAVTSRDAPYTLPKRFEDLNLTPELLKGLYNGMNFSWLSKIQEITLPLILTPPYKNLVAQAHNGSGKTTCFVLGMLSRVDPKLVAPQALCICPTRELAIQNMEVLLKIGKFTGITSELAINPYTADYMPVQNRPSVTAQIVIGTLGTIQKLVIARKLGMSCMKILVFDEADYMLAEGFRSRVVSIMKAIPNDCQVLMFSATFKDDVKAFISKIFKEKDYNQMFVKKEELLHESVKQYKVHCPNELAKIRVIRDKILELGAKVGQTIIFIRNHHTAGYLRDFLVEHGYEVAIIQGALKVEDRDKIIKEFKEEYTPVLIATDVLARGFYQSGVNLVINYNLPVKNDNPKEPDYECYLHRVGRAGHFGRKGAVFNLCDPKDDMLMLKIENHFKSQVIEVPSWTSYSDFVAALRNARLL